MTDVNTSKDFRDRYYRHAVKNTFCHCCTCYMIILGLTMLVNAIYPALYPGDGSQVAIVDPFAPAMINFDGKKYSQQQYQAEEVDSRLTDESSFLFVYDSVDGTDLFTPENLQLMCQMEEFVFQQATVSISCNTATTDDGVCVTQKSSGLLTGTSIVSLFYAYNESDASTNWFDVGTGFPLPLNQPGAGSNASSCYLLSESEVDYVKNTIFNAIESSDTAKSLYGFFLDKDSLENGFSTASRSIIPFSVPVPSESGDIEIANITAVVRDSLFELLDMKPGFLRSVYRDDSSVDNVNLIFFELDLILSEFGNLISTDFFMVFGSMTFVFFWMWIYTRSLIVTIPCVFSIFLSVTVAMAVYKLVFQIEFFDFIHILAVFLILGIGADDLFVVFDAWKQSELHHKEELERFKYTVNRSTQSVFNTSFTTAAAFFVTGITPLVPISTFGIFAALTIIVCFVYTMTLFPTTVLLWHRFVNRNKKDEANVESIHEEELKRQHEKINLDDLRNGKNYLLYRFYIPLVEKYDKWFVLLGFIVGIIGAVGLTNFSPLTKPEEFLPKDHMLQIFQDSVGDKWLSGADNEFIPLDIYWGIEGIERNVLGWYTGNESRYGDVLVYDENFDLSDYAAQEAISNFCQTLVDEPCTFQACEESADDSGRLVLQTSTSQFCTIDVFHEYWEQQYNNTDYAKSDKSASEVSFFYEALQNFTAENGYSEYVGFLDDELVYFGTSWRLNANPISPASLKAPLENRLTEMISEYNEAAPDTAKNARFSSQEFVQNAVENALAATVLRGLSITFPIVFVVLLFATNNYILAFFACLSIAFIVIVVLGIVFTILGWELGIAESIVAIMIVGLSVDYTVHLGHMYTFAGTDEGFEKRSDRFKYAILTMGPTVFAGATTTLGAGLFLFGAQIIFFTKMGVLLTLTVTFSLYYSFFFMMCAASWIGPERNYARFLSARKNVFDEQDSDKVVDLKP